LKIHHALKETSYLTDTASMTFSGGMAITIGDYLWEARTGGFKFGGEKML
jgi:hypothetical protein